MSEDIDKRVLRKYEIREKLGKGVRCPGEGSNARAAMLVLHKQMIFRSGLASRNHCEEPQPGLNASSSRCRHMALSGGPLTRRTVRSLPSRKYLMRFRTQRTLRCVARPRLSRLPASLPCHIIHMHCDISRIHVLVACLPCTRTAYGALRGTATFVQACIW